ncbi:hypothetical protein Salat_1871800 [Sesamum alatum]|uniref:Uncharacterized protein n=1 Tax=Sesamum alatum TaxID=300844 RepID=A0AAE1Y415_9LAMI|nr:hypothetical protein Salat_1871800 [Sesamum alatum]
MVERARKEVFAAENTQWCYRRHIPIPDVLNLYYTKSGSYSIRSGYYQEWRSLSRRIMRKHGQLNDQASDQHLKDEFCLQMESYINTNGAILANSEEMGAGVIARD